MPTFDMPKTYDPAASERRIYDWWEKSGFFKPEIAGPDAEPFVISIPPPNLTGELHLGHAMFVSLEDLMIRYKRMRGYAALWVPGYDHAGIATQLQVEKMLAREGTRRQDLGREEFLRRTWEWKEKYGDHIVRQLRRLGASCDWDRMRFTLDDGLSRAVREAFVRLYRMGLIYRGEYLVNWSPGLQTAVSDLEVEYSDEEAPRCTTSSTPSPALISPMGRARATSRWRRCGPRRSWAIPRWRCIPMMSVFAT